MAPDKRARNMKSQKEEDRDYFSNMPDDIISDVLSRLPAKYAVQTCVLSKVWEYKWDSINDINIYDGDFCERKLFEAYCEEHDLMFVNFVDRILLRAQNVKKFRFASMVWYDRSQIETWLSTVFGHNIQNFFMFSQRTVILPRNFSSCTSLRTLEMKMPCYWKTHVKNYFPHLTKLYLDGVVIVNENSSTDMLVFHFPVLETFQIGRHEWTNVKFVEIYAPALISFKSDTWGRREFGAYVIKIIGAGIQKFETRGHYLEAFNLTAPTVSSAAMKNYIHLNKNVVKCGQQIRRLLNEFSSLKSLELSCYFTVALGLTKSGLRLPSFSKLEKLSLSSPLPLRSFQGLFEGLLELLHATPLLKHMSLDIICCVDEDYEYDTLDSVPSCVVLHLEDIEFDHFTGYPPEFPLAMFCMKHAAKLKNLSLHTHGENEEEIAEQLLKFPKASTCLTTVVT